MLYYLITLLKMAQAIEGIISMKGCSNYFFGLLVILGSLGTAEATLHSRLGGTIVYDDDLDISWLANANLADTNTFGVSGITAAGTMNWDTANNWIAAMNAFNGGLGYLDHSDWRLPNTLLPNDPSCTTDAAGTTPSGSGATGFNCSGSEMGHLFYTELSGTAGNQVTLSGDSDLGLFTNIEDDESVSPLTSSYFASEAGSGTNAWRFRFGTGSQAAINKNFNLYAWAVLDGDVDLTNQGSVPVPAAIWFFASGLLGLIVSGNRRKKA